MDGGTCREMERKTGFEPATNSLEGCDSTPELLPRSCAAHLDRRLVIRAYAVRVQDGVRDVQAALG